MDIRLDKEGEKNMRFLLVVLIVLMSLVPCQVAAMTWEEFVETYGEMPPAPPDASNTDVWVDPFTVQGDYSDGGESIHDMNSAAFIERIDWTGNEVWLWS